MADVTYRHFPEDIAIGLFPKTWLWYCLLLSQLQRAEHLVICTNCQQEILVLLCV